MTIANDIQTAIDFLKLMFTREQRNMSIEFFLEDTITGQRLVRAMDSSDMRMDPMENAKRALIDGGYFDLIEATVSEKNLKQTVRDILKALDAVSF